MSRAKFIAALILAVGIMALFFYRESLNRMSPEELPSMAISDEVQETNGVKHLIPLSAAVSGGVARDGIPSIDDPQFESVAAADEYLNDDGEGLMVEVDGDVRFYPYQILVWHEIVNDTFGDRSLAITFCPLCYTGIVYDRDLDGDIGVVTFGTSGKLYDNNLLMYDRTTDTLWSQAYGKAVIGELTGTELEMHPALPMTWAAFKSAYPYGDVLSRDTGAVRDYTRDPYREYYGTNDVWFPLSHMDDRLPAKTIVFGYANETGAKAYPIETIKKMGEITDSVGGEEITLLYNEELGTVEVNGSSVLVQSFWFSWAATHPETDVYVVE
jgi:hypothetical protein